LHRMRRKEGFAYAAQNASSSLVSIKRAYLTAKLQYTRIKISSKNVLSVFLLVVVDGARTALGMYRRDKMPRLGCEIRLVRVLQGILLSINKGCFWILCGFLRKFLFCLTLIAECDRIE